MKNKFTVVLCLLMSTAAWAGNEGPQADPQMPLPTPKLAAKVVIASFFHPPSMYDVETVQIRRDGTIERVREWHGGRTETAAIAKLDKKVAAHVVAEVEAVIPGSIADPNPSRPGCMDAPTTTYVAVQKAGETQIAQRVNCIDLDKSNTTEADIDVKSALEAALSLSDLIP